MIVANLTFMQEKVRANPFAVQEEETGKYSVFYGHRNAIKTCELADSGFGTTGDEFDIISPSHPWEESCIEGSCVIHMEGYYYLFCGGGVWSNQAV